MTLTLTRVYRQPSNGGGCLFVQNRIQKIRNNLRVSCVEKESQDRSKYPSWARRKLPKWHAVADQKGRSVRSELCRELSGVKDQGIARRTSRGAKEELAKKK